jgi:hypothetical protein
MGGIVSSVIGGVTGAVGSAEAANSQVSGEKKAINSLTNWYNTAQGYQDPYVNAGKNALTTLTGQLPDLIKPITMDQATLEQTPGYQFQLNQGLQAVQNSYAAKGLGSSGAALRGAADYASGLASSNYQQQFNNALTNKQFTLGTLMGLTGVGQTAANVSSGNALTTGQGIANADVGIGNAQAQGWLGATGAIGNAANSAQGWNFLQNNPTALRR